MKQICIDARMAFHSGIGTYIRALLPSIRESFPSVRVLAPLSFIKKWPLLEKFNLIPCEAPIYSIQEQWKIPWKALTCDLFWSPHYNIPLLPIRAKKRLVTIHDVYHLAFGKSLSLLKRSYAKLMIPAAIKRSDHVITVSQFSRDEILRTAGGGQEKISVVPNGVNSHLFAFPTPSSKLSQVRSFYSLPENYVLFVSNLALHKNLARLFKAWSLVVQKHAHWQLIIVGKQPNDKASHLQHTIKCLGWVAEDDLPALYQMAYVLIYPSIYEGFGLPPLEAMSMCCPVIVSKTASLPEVCGDAALYIDPFSEEDIAQKICMLIENRAMRQTLIEKGKGRMEHFSWKKSAQAHLEIIHQMIT